jgi:hypothetical protein
MHKPSPTAALGVAVSGGQLNGVWNLADLRFAVQADRVRFVIEMEERRDHVPFYRAVQVGNASSPFPTGYDAAWGAARIDLLVGDLYAYGSMLLDALPVELPANPRVLRVGLYPTYEDSVLGFSLGLEAASAYTISELVDPVRIVVDVSW